jgi:hypothetical protein
MNTAENKKGRAFFFSGNKMDCHLLAGLLKKFVLLIMAGGVRSYQ